MDLFHGPWTTATALPIVQSCSVRASPVVCSCLQRVEDILKVDFCARSKLKDWNFAQENAQKYHLKSLNMCETWRQNCKRGYNAYFFSLGMQISRFCAKSEFFCAVARPWDKPSAESAQLCSDVQCSDYPIYASVDWVAPLSPISLCVVLQWLPLVTMALFLSPLWWQWQSFQLFCSHKQWSQSTLLTMGVSLEAAMDCSPFKQWKRSNKERRQQPHWRIRKKYFFEVLNGETKKVIKKSRHQISREIQILNKKNRLK